MGDELEKTKMLYEENSKVTHTFWEWRHKVMTRYFVTLGSLVAVAGWFFKTQELRFFSSIPFLLIAIFSVISKKLDGINTWVLRACYDKGEMLERNLSEEDHIYGVLNKGHYDEIKGSYHDVLSKLYGFSAWCSLGIALVIFTALLIQYIIKNPNAIAWISA